VLDPTLIFDKRV